MSGDGGVPLHHSGSVTTPAQPSTCVWFMRDITADESVHNPASLLPPARELH